MNIYLPDDLAADIRAELGEANISGIAQSALRAELARARGLQALADEGGFQRVEAVDRDEDVAFQGRKIGSDDGQHLTASGYRQWGQDIADAVVQVRNLDRHGLRIAGQQDAVILGVNVMDLRLR